MDNGVTAGLANDQIGPLHNHNRGEEGSMAGVLKNLTVVEGLLEKVELS